MAHISSETKQEIFQSNFKEKPALACNIIGDLNAVADEVADENVEQLWLEEAQRRYQAYVAGEIKVKSAQEVFAKARQQFLQ